MKLAIPLPRESEVLAGCLKACRALGVLCWRHNVGQFTVDGRVVRAGVKGQSDILGVVRRGPHRGKLLSIEVKRPRGRATPRQIEWMRDVIEAGGIAFRTDSLADCVDLLQRVLGGARVEIDRDGGQRVVPPEPL